MPQEVSSEKKNRKGTVSINLIKVVATNYRIGLKLGPQTGRQINICHSS